MKKFFLALLISIATMLFLFVAFFAGTLIGVEGWCAFDQCAQDMRKGGTPSPFFEVIVRLPAEGNRLTSVRLNDWPGYHAKNPDSTLTLQATVGETDTKWRYTIMSPGGEPQLVHAHNGKDDPTVQVEYETHGETVKPLYSKALKLGYMFSSFPFGLFLAWLVHRLTLRRRQPARIQQLGPTRPQSIWNTPLGSFFVQQVCRMPAAIRRWLDR